MDPDLVLPALFVLAGAAGTCAAPRWLRTVARALRRRRLHTAMLLLCLTVSAPLLALIGAGGLWSAAEPQPWSRGAAFLAIAVLVAAGAAIAASTPRARNRRRARAHRREPALSA